ncbi:peptidoglycan D,D-transpeptidase FtsI family protein [Coralliovum pocilloporae]|uniref:peptidoglycan D,D-transpeptidase FtsI family protein n=1 Tax=Coralliovum pocilloporae TaxID=3066369 RepID=UPI003307616F
MKQFFQKRWNSRPEEDASGDDGVVLEGSQKGAVKIARSRTVLVALVFLGLYAAIAGRLIQLAQTDTAQAGIRLTAKDAIAATRPNLLDRNGEILATDIQSASLYAEPRRVVDVDEAVERILSVLPDLSESTLRERLESGRGFVWLKREITPRQQAALHALGLPGLGFLPEKRRFYPSGPTAAHVIGHVNVDNQGIAGIEKHLDDEGLADLRDFGFARNQRMEPVNLSIDLRVQHVLRDELAKAKEFFKADAVSGIVLSAKTGEVFGLASLPDYDPNDPATALDDDRINRVTAGVYEMGSTFKAFTTAMALDSGRIRLSDQFDATKPIRRGGFTISDFHAKKRSLSVSEIFIYSSNIGTAKMALSLGKDAHQDFLRRLGLLTRLKTELPENRRPLAPRDWTDLSTMTISFGHGLSVAPIQTAAAAAALVNGGRLIKPTFFVRSAEEAYAAGEQVLLPETSRQMRYLFKLNSEEGSGRKANVLGYRVGGKTGTSEKVVNGRYAKDRLYTSFLSAFPMDDPEFVVLIMLDEPKAAEGTFGYATAGYNAAPTAGKVIARIAPMLGVRPKFDGIDAQTILVSF